jgi:glutamate--cysteine ligase
LLDSWGKDETYRSALAAQREKLQGQEWSVPSARVLASMEASGLGHRDWVLALSRQHQETLRSEPLAPDVLADYQRMSRESLAEQDAQEQSDKLPFATFLEEYLRS